MKEEKRYTLRLTKEMDENLKKISKKKLLSKNALVRIAIDEFLKENKFTKGE
ncbi:hypothetical protein [Streptobacillus moniliformis]|uniref:hypothetical protein n=1 Tax=Streptobacillus moniliformis TaxID=34105 RepID=UPI000AD9B715|nr:hypothetical protein [Streptobacillus moniliformis]